MTTLKTMRDRIYDETLRSDLSVNQVNGKINDAIRLWEGQRFHFNERRYLILTVAEQEYYDLSGSGLLEPDGTATGTGEEILEIDSITNTINQWPYPLTPRTQSWMDYWTTEPEQYIGQPDSYGLYNSQIRLYPIPDSAGPEAGGAYPIRISCLARLAPYPLSQDDDANAWLGDGEILIREQAKLLIYSDLVGSDPESQTMAQRTVDTAYANLARRNSARANTGQIRAWNL